MIKIGGVPILTHIMRLFKFYGYDEFIIASGYKGKVIQNYYKSSKEFRNIKIIPTGRNTMTGGRILKLKNLLKSDESFFMTYGDGVSNVNIKKLLNYHKIQNKLATISIVQPVGRFGAVKINAKDNLIKNFSEKIKGDGGWINGGFFVLNKRIFKYLKDDNTMWEKEPLEILAKQKELVGYKHNDFWYPCDTIRDKIYLENLWNANKAPWKIWK